ncbi:GtrA family protein [Candidatus Venteria ishoeyi]|uniref:GtrA-like protein n=1 Tax=Candidatus Venteria ishoeyi TaxID=1899563 RepID=A0A1H6F622_9GAMM|nr:GtrA-like protein [Candidatus Venteria ishoeyi]
MLYGYENSTIYRLIRFILSGGLTTILYGAFNTFFILFGHYSILFSHTMSYLLCIPISYLLHRNFTFRHKGKQSESAAKFITIIAITYTISSIFTWVLVDNLQLSPYIATLMIMIVIPVVSYLTMYLWVFINE